ADVDKCAERHHLADDALDGLSLDQILFRLFGLLLALGGEHVAPREDDVALSESLHADDRAIELLADEDGEIRDAVECDLACRHECAMPRDFKLEPNLLAVLARRHPRHARLDHLAGLEHLPVGFLHGAGPGTDKEILARLELVNNDLELITDFGNL